MPDPIAGLEVSLPGETALLVTLVSISTAHDGIGGSAEAVRLALTALERHEVVRKITAGRYARAWAADDLFDILNEYEHDLATPTRVDQRPRPSPRPRKV